MRVLNISVEDPQEYGYAAGFGLSQTCESEVIAQLIDLQRRAAEYARRDGRVAADDFFYAEQNARLVKNAEQYYRTMFRGRVSSWNLRDRHMAETLDSLVEHFALQKQTRKGGGVGTQLPLGRRARHADGPSRRMERRTTCPRKTRPRLRPDRLHHVFRHRDGSLELGRAGGTEKGSSGNAGKL